ncbi:MAG TPA: NUDIX domain-containing protein [Anaerolineales bacterium]
MRSEIDQSIRPVVIGLFGHADKILVFQGFDSVKDELFYRPLGGMIEFGESAQDALRREIVEELGQEVFNLRYLGALENIFVYEGEPGHEIVLVYDGEFRDASIYNEEIVEGYEHDAGRLTYQAMWKSLEEFRAKDAPPLYPDGLLDLLLKIEGGKSCAEGLH